jgi:hypothetical protein
MSKLMGVEQLFEGRHFDQRGTLSSAGYLHQSPQHGTDGARPRRLRWRPSEEPFIRSPRRGARAPQPLPPPGTSASSHAAQRRRVDVEHEAGSTPERRRTSTPWTKAASISVFRLAA